MGEAKRRKLLDPEYGTGFKVDCFLAHSEYSDAHGIYLLIENRRRIENTLLFVIADIKEALEKLAWIKNTIKQCSLASSDANSFIVSKVVEKSVELYGDFETDDMACICQGDSIETVKPPIKKRFKPLLAVGIPESPSDSLYLVGLSEDERPVPTINNEVGLFSYTRAAYVADYMNANNLEEYSMELTQKLYIESIALQRRLGLL